jgi:hypothetical protein
MRCSRAEGASADDSTIVCAPSWKGAWTIAIRIRAERGVTMQIRQRIVLTCVTAGVLFDGLLAGSTVDRFVAGVPAWKHVGVVAWAEYSRHADLGYGLILYPVLAIGGCLLALAAVAGWWRDREAQRAPALPLCLGAALAVAGLVTTLGAAPQMLGLRNGENDPAALAAVFAAFYRWSAVRAVFQILSFPAELWALLTLTRKT